MSIIILAIESSCDDTSAAVSKDAKILANLIAGQKVHELWGGVVPELASRAHQQNILPVVHAALEQAEISKNELSAVAFTRGPGLIGSLLVGTSFAKAFALALNLPLIEVNHMQAHILAHFIDNKPSFPFLCLTVSGGHTQIVLVKDFLKMEVVGETLDDAAGEAFDKVAKLIGLDYPGGPAISRAAESGDVNKYQFPVANLGRDSFDFSFSGLKTAVLRQIQDITGHNPGVIDGKKSYSLDPQVVSDLSASFQKAAIGALIKQTHKAYLQFKPKTLVVGGGVAANSYLREKMQDRLNKELSQRGSVFGL